MCWSPLLLCKHQEPSGSHFEFLCLLRSQLTFSAFWDFFFFFLATPLSMWDLSFPTRLNRCAPCIHHWTTREVSSGFLFGKSPESKSRPGLASSGPALSELTHCWVPRWCYPTGRPSARQKLSVPRPTLTSRPLFLRFLSSDASHPICLTPILPILHESAPPLRLSFIYGLPLLPLSTECLETSLVLSW